MKESETLRAAAKLVNHGWTQGVSSRDARGHPVAISDSSAVSFCLLGSVSRSMTGRDVQDFNSILCRHLGFASSSKLVEWNDAPERTQKEVVKVLKDAAKELEAQGR